MPVDNFLTEVHSITRNAVINKSQQTVSAVTSLNPERSSTAGVSSSVIKLL